MLRATLTAVAVIGALAGCGGNSDPARAEAMRHCMTTSNTQHLCECALNKLAGEGLDSAGYNREIADGSAATDKRLYSALGSCLTG